MSNPRKADLHRLKTRTWRAEDEEVAAAKDNLPDGQNMGAFLRACVRTLGTDPAAVLATVTAHWPPEPQITGRPRTRRPTTD